MNAHRHGASTARTITGRRFRPELHGLRGLAIALVVAYHVWFGRVSGGVDVFLFLSAFLLTGTFLGRAERGEPLRPVPYWGRTFKRLLPPAVLVILVSLIGVLTLRPPRMWLPELSHALGSLLQVENLVLISRGTDYYAADAGSASVFQHFWSLSIQGQVFLLWPLLMTVVVAVARHRGTSIRRSLLIAFAGILLVSFAWSVISTITQQAVAYFDTRARLWEFAAGSLLALLLPALESSRRGTRGGRLWRAVIGWAGLLALVSCGLLLDVQGQFPGWIAAWPLAAAALVLWAGDTGLRISADRLLSSVPFRFLGDISYGLYLVHWPLLVLHLAHSGKERAGVIDGLVLVVASLLLAWLLTRTVDTPVRRWRWAGARARRAGLVAVVSLALGLAPVLGIQQHLRSGATGGIAPSVETHPGARALGAAAADSAQSWALDPLPTAALTATDWYHAPEECSGDWAPQDPALAEKCRVLPAPDGAETLVVVGNSRMQQLSAAILPVAGQEGWRVITLLHPGCEFAPGDPEILPACRAYSDAVATYLHELRPDAVALATTYVPTSVKERSIRQLEPTLAAFAADGIRIMAFRDQPRLPTDPNVCEWKDRGRDLGACTYATTWRMRTTRPDDEALRRARDLGAAVAEIDLTESICPDGACVPMVGNVRVFTDRGHISATYASTLSEALRDELEAAGWQW